MIKLDTPYSPQLFKVITDSLFGDQLIRFSEPKVVRQKSYWKYITSMSCLGEIPEWNISVYVIEHSSMHDPRISLTRELFRSMSGAGHCRAIVALVHPESDVWRLSLVTMDLNIDDTTDKIIRTYSNAKRFSFLLGLGERVKTPTDLLMKKGRVKNFSDLLSRFNTEVVRKEFFDDYMNLYVRLYQALLVDTALCEILEDQGVEKVAFTKNLLGKIVFIYFLQKKGWLGLGKDQEYGKGDTDFIRHLWKRFTIKDDFVRHSTGYFYNDYLEYLFYDGFNRDRRDDGEWHSDKRLKIPYLNGGLFQEDYQGWEEFLSTLDNAIFSNDNEDGILDVFDRYNFTIDEDDIHDSEIAVDPEMLGKIFEYMISVSPDNIDNIVTEYQKKGRIKVENALNKKLGAFYTPRDIVDSMCRESLALSMAAKTSIPVDRLKDLFMRARGRYDSQGDVEFSQLVPAAQQQLIDEIRIIDDQLATLKILDPAVGSGAYPMGLLSQIAQVRYYFREHGYIGDDKTLYVLKKETIQDSIYGVDIEPGAIEIARLRFWLSLVVDAPSPEPLPNLEFKFVCANTLLPLAEESIQKNLFGDQDEPRMETLKDYKRQYYRAQSKSDKARIKEKIRTYTNIGQMTVGGTPTQRASQMHEFGKGFDDPTHSHSFFDAPLMLSEWRGFDIVIGNPPYFNVSTLARTQMQKDLESQKYKTFTKKCDIYCLFYEIGIRSLKKDGILAYITSNKWMRADYGEKLRGFFAELDPLILIDCGPGIFESATVDTNILIVRNRQRAPTSLRAFTLMSDDRGNIDLLIETKSTTLTKLTSDPWFIGSSVEIALKVKIESIGTPLKDWGVKIYRGVLTGLNEAFIVSTEKRARLIAEDPKSEEIIKPILRGRDIQRYGYQHDGIYLLQTGFDFNIPCLYPAIFRHLKELGDKIERGEIKVKGKGLYSRDDQGKNWYNLRACVYYDEFDKENVVWGQFQDGSEYSLAPAGYYLSSNEYMLCGEYSRHYLLGFLNSKITKWYLDTLSNSLGGNASIFQKSVFVELPIPLITDANRGIVEAIEERVDRILSAKKADSTADTSVLEREIDGLVYELYGLSEEERGVVDPNYYI